MSDKTPDADEQNLIVNQLIADFISRRNAGEKLSIEDFVAEHPNLTDELKRQFANDSVLEAFKESDRKDVAETIVGSGNAGGISAEDATAQTVVGGSDTSVTQSHQQRNTGSTTSIEIPENFGRYAIQKVLGQGAMGAVYLAKDTQLDRDVALKIPKFGDENGVDDEELLARFYREARASATIRSLNICPVYDVGEIDGQHYITMAFIEGRPLKDYTQSKKSHPEKQIISTIRKLASGLAEAHKIGVVHRDLKPANIMVDQNGEPVVMDFGLARRSSSDDVQVTQSGAILGTPAYMSPEQIEGDQSVIGPQTDIYALGVIMYELITGEMPFKGSLITLISQIAANNPAKPSKLRKDIDPRLETICLKMMESDLGQRYQSMTEVADDLQDVLRNPGKQQTKEQAKKQGPKPISLPSANEESNPALISIEQPKSYAEQLRERKGKRSRKKSKVTSKTKSKPTQTAKSGSRSSGPPKNLLIAGGVGGLLLLLGIFYLVRGGSNDVQITLDEPVSKHSGAVLKESSDSGHDGKIMGAKLLKVGNDSGADAIASTDPANLINALELDGIDDYIEIGTVKVQPGPYTIETWVYRKHDDRKTAQVATVYFGDAWANLTWKTENGREFLTYAHNDGVKSNEQLAREYFEVRGLSGRWVHLACTWDGERAEIFVDGRHPRRNNSAQTSSPKREVRPSTLGAGIGEKGNSYSPFLGMIAQFRLTNDVRYDKDFVPDYRFTADKNTIVLYHFDEGQGEDLKDSSGNGHDGKIVGAKWVGASGAAFATEGDVELTRGLVGHWNFEEEKGTRVTDSSGNGNHGTLLDMDAKVWSDETPPSILAGQHSLQFNKNTKNRIEIPNSASLGIKDQITVAFWAKVSNVSGTVLSKEYDRVFKISGSADGWRWQIAMFPDVRGSENSHDFFTRPRDLPGKWTHLAARYDGREICWFINGTRQSQEPYTRPLQTYRNSLFLGNEKGGNAPIDGHLDDVRIYNRALNEAEIEVLSGNAKPKNGLLSTKDTNTPPLLDIAPLNAAQAKQHALQFANANDVVTLANKAAAQMDLLTVEMWVASEIPPVSKMERRHLTSVGIEHGLINLDLRYNFNQVAQTSLIADVQGQTNLWTTETIRAGKYAGHGWMHIAYTWTGHKMQIYLNGQGQEDMHRSGGDEGKRLADTVLATLGGKSSLGQPFQGRIRELRISKSVRYQKNFEVTSPDVPFTADANTLALYHFDEGTGDVLKDSSGNGNDGKIVGAKWVEVSNDTSQPIDLLADLEPTAMNSNDLKWQMKDGILSCSISSSSATKKKKWVGATFPQKISGDADFDLELKQSGFAPLQIDLPLGDKQAIRLHLGGLGCALMEIDGKGDRDVDPQYRNKDVKLKRKVWQRLTAQVRHHGENIDVDVALDGIRIGRFSGLRSRITLPSWVKPDPVHVKFAGNGDLSAIQLEFRRVLVTPISSVASPSGNRSDGEAIVASPPPLAVAPFDAIQAKQHQQAWADYLGLPVEKEVTLPGGQKMTFMLIPPGEFMMGSTQEEQARNLSEAQAASDKWGAQAIEREFPRQRVRITKPFYFGKYEVTRAQWNSVMGTNVDGEQSRPIESISWEDIQPFLTKVNAASKMPDTRFALPTQFQWEYACRAGSETAWYCGNDEADLRKVGWYSANAGGKTNSVGRLAANAFGTHDQHGNVSEWCADWRRDNPERAPVLTDPSGPDSGEHRMQRGGGITPARMCRAAYRSYRSPSDKGKNIGFRLTLSIDTSKLKLKTMATTQNPVKSPSDGESTSVSLLEMLTSSEYEWTEPVNLGPQINSNQGDNHPTASGDGLILMFESARDPNTIRLFECSRSSIDEPWSTPRAIDELNRIMATDPKLSHDGLSLLFVSPRGGKKQDLFLSRRSKRDAPWQDPVNLGPEVNSNEIQGGGGFSPDGLTLFFKRPKKSNTTLKFSDMWRAQRSAVDAPWDKAASLGPEINLDDGGVTGEVQPLADGKSLLYTNNKRLFLAQRDDTGKFQVRKLETKTLFYNFTLTDNGTLLFTSDKQGGIGKGDLWMSRRVRKD